VAVMKDNEKLASVMKNLSEKKKKEKVIADLKKIDEYIKEKEEISADLKKKAMAAIAQNNEELAKEHLSKKIKQEQDIADLVDIKMEKVLEIAPEAPWEILETPLDDEREEKKARELDAREKAEREAREKAEREAREKAVREAREKAVREAREKAVREAREKTERERAEQIRQERDLVISVLHHECDSGHSLAVKEIVRLLDMDVDAARKCFDLVNAPVIYSAEDEPSLKKWATRVLKALVDPTLLGVLELSEKPSLAMAKAIGKFLVEKHLVDSFPRCPVSKNSALSNERTQEMKSVPIPFPAYQGKELFVFASYAHADRDRVYPVIDRLHAAGIRIWYDEGIPGSTEWEEVIANKIAACTCFIVFLTPASVTRHDVWTEVSFAKNQYKKRGVQILPIYLESFNLPEKWELSIGTIQAITGISHNDDELVGKVLTTIVSDVKEQR
jgi:hypothetical protein